MNMWANDTRPNEMLRREEFFFLHKMPTNIVHRETWIIYQMQHFSIPFYFSLSFFFFCCWFFSCVGVDALSTAVLCGATSFNHISQCERCSISIELRLVLSTLLFFFFSSCARLWFALISTLRAFPWIPTGNLGIFWWWKWTTRDQTSICS